MARTAVVKRCYAPLLFPDATVEQQPDIVRLYNGNGNDHGNGNGITHGCRT